MTDKLLIVVEETLRDLPIEQMEKALIRTMVNTVYVSGYTDGVKHVYRLIEEKKKEAKA